MWRDRTNLYISYRQSYSHQPAKKSRYGGPSSRSFGDGGASIAEERRGLMSEGAFDDSGDVVIEMDLLPPRWLDVQDEINEYLTQIATETQRLEQLHQKHVLPGFDDESVKLSEEREIEQLTQQITRRFHQCQKALRRLDAMVREAKEQGSLGSGEERLAKNLKISLATRVGDVSALFRKKQSAYLKKLRHLGGFASPIPPRSSTPLAGAYADHDLEESENDRSFSQSTLLQSKQQRLTQGNDAVIAQREREIEEIAQGIIELSNIFQDIQTMVIDQGTMLDRIDYNVERMAVEVKAADKELTVATGYQKRSIKRKIILLLIIVVAGMFILLSLKLNSKKGSSEPPPPPPSENAPPIDPQPPLLQMRRAVADFDLGPGSPWADWKRRRRRMSWDALYATKL